MIGISRGGVPVAAEVARVLGLPLEICIVRKLVAPGDPPITFGAVAEDGARDTEEARVRELGLSNAEVDAIAAQQDVEVMRLGELLRASLRSSCAAEICSSSTMVRSQAARSGQASARSGYGERAGSSSPCRSPTARCSRRSVPRSMASCAWSPIPCSSRSAPATTTSGRSRRRARPHRRPRRGRYDRDPCLRTARLRSVGRAICARLDRGRACTASRHVSHARAGLASCHAMRS